VRACRAVVLALGVAALVSGCGGKAATTAPHPSAFSSFQSRPDLRPPIVTIRTAARRTAPGYVFLAPKEKTSPGGPLIVDDDGEVVWFHSIQPVEASDFRVQRFHGRPVLTWWEGRVSKTGVGVGRYVVADSSYRTIAAFRAGHSLDGDLHEFLLTPRGTALITVYRPVPRDLTSVGGPRQGWAYDSIVQEIDVATRHVVFEWHSLAHVPLAESILRKPAKTASRRAAPFDYFHVNAIEEESDGNLLLSARNTHTIYEVARDGRVLWRLGGKRSDFRLGPGTRFAYQHDVRRGADGTLTVFDNSAVPKVADHSRALVIRLDLAAKKATLVHAYAHPARLLSPYEGNAQRLPNGDLFVGWGGKPYFTEFAPSGRVLFDGRFPTGDSYRAYRFPWAGRPTEPPAVAARKTGDGVTVYASWNGATAVASWEVLAGDDEGALRPVKTAAKFGFETAIPLGKDARLVAVRALDGAGKVLRESPAVEPS
jgi:hypothetical protein